MKVIRLTVSFFVGLTAVAHYSVGSTLVLYYVDIIGSIVWVLMPLLTMQKSVNDQPGAPVSNTIPEFLRSLTLATVADKHKNDSAVLCVNRLVVSFGRRPVVNILLSKRGPLTAYCREVGTAVFADKISLIFHSALPITTAIRVRR